MSVVDSAPPSSPLELTDDQPKLFMKRDQPNVPSAVTVPGSSNFDLMLFDIVATGTVKPASPGTLTLTLYGAAKGDDNLSSDPATWLPLAASEAEPIGGPEDLQETMWMIRGKDLMIFPGSGRLQGMFDSNIANHPIPPLDLDQHPGDITAEDPLYIFAVGASFETAVEAPPARTGREAEAEPICTLNLANFSMNA